LLFLDYCHLKETPSKSDFVENQRNSDFEENLQNHDGSILKKNEKKKTLKILIILFLKRMEKKKTFLLKI
jgi:hypothetical protein